MERDHKILYIHYLKAYGSEESLKNLYKECRNDYRAYTFYIEEYLKPWFESLRRENRLIKGNTAHLK